MKNSNFYTGTKTLESMNGAKFYNRWILNKFKHFLKGDILEVGCGIGNFSSELSKHGKVTAIDIDVVLIKEIKNEKEFQIDAGWGDIEKGKYFFQGKTFDTIVCLNVLEHINQDVQALENILKLIKKGGNLIIIVPIYQFLYGEIDKNIGHYRRYNPQSIINQIKSLGLEIILYRKLNFLGAIGWFCAGRVLKDKHVEADRLYLFNILAPFFLAMEDLIEPPVGTSIMIIAEKK